MIKNNVVDLYNMYYHHGLHTKQLMDVRTVNRIFTSISTCRTILMLRNYLTAITLMRRTFVNMLPKLHPGQLTFLS